MTVTNDTNDSCITVITLCHKMKIKKKLKIPIQFKIEYLSNSACQFQLASKTDGKTNILTFAIA